MNILFLILITMIRGLAAPDEEIKEPYSEQLHISERTTFITEPLLPDGRVDYLTAYDCLATSDITPENNILVDLLGAFKEHDNAHAISQIENGDIKEYGPSSEQAKSWRRQYWKKLGVSPPRPESLMMLSLKRYDNENARADLLQVYSQSEIDEKRKALLADDSYCDLKARYDNGETDDNEVLQWLYADLISDEYQITYYQPWTEKECPLSAQWAKTTGPIEEKIIEISRKTGYYAPVVILENEEFNVYTLRMPHLDLVLDVKYFLRLKMQWHLGCGNDDAAIECAFAAIRIGRTIQNNARGSSEYIFALGMEEMGLNLLLDEWENFKTRNGDAWLHKKRDQYQAIPTLPRSWEKQPLWMTGHRYVLLSTIQEMQSKHKPLHSCLEEIPPCLLYDFHELIDEEHRYNWNEILRQINIHFDAVEDILVLPGHDRQIQAAIREENHFKRLTRSERESTDADKDLDQIAADYLYEEFFGSYHILHDFIRCEKRLDEKRQLLKTKFH